MRIKDFLKKHSKLIGFVIAVFFLYLAFRNTRFSSVLERIQQMDFLYLACSLGCMFLLFFFKAVRWKVMLQVLRKIRLNPVFACLMMGYFAHNILPFRVGELLRVYYLGKREPIAKTSILGSIVGEKFFDGLSLLLIALIFVPMNPALEENQFIKAIRILVYVIAGIALFYLLYTKMPKKFSKLIRRNLLALLKGNYYRKVMGFFTRFFHGISFLKSYKALLYSVLSSLLIWAVDALSIYFLFLSFHVDMPNLLLNSFIPVLVINIGIMIPSGPGDIGLFHYFGKLALAGILGMDDSLASSLIIMLNFITILPGFILGGFYMILEHARIRLKEAE